MPWTPDSRSPLANSQSLSPIPLLLAAPDPARLYSALVGDERFQVQALARSPEEMADKLALQPQALLIEGTLYPSPEELNKALAGVACPTVLLLPAHVPQEGMERVQRLPQVVEMVYGAYDLPALADRLAEAVTNRQGTSAPANGYRPARAVAAAGWRCVAVWNLAGGVGKSTVATALALEAAQRRLPTLLVGLGAPDTLPLLLGLHPHPNLTTWRERPRSESLPGAVQSVDSLDILAGFPSPVELAAYLPDALEGSSSLPSLAQAAAHAGYAVVVFDVSAQELAPAALAACNSVVLVGLSTLAGVALSVESQRLVQEVLAGRHPIPPEAMHLVLNRVRPSSLTPDEALQAARRSQRRLPPLAAVIRDDPAIEESASLQRPAYFHSDPLRQAAKVLGDLLFAPPAAAKSSPPPQGKVYTMGPLRVRV